MLDPKLIRGDLPMLAGQLARRQFVLDVEVLSDLEAKRKSAQTAMETLQAERNRVSKAIGQAKAKGEDTAPIMATVSDLGAQLDHQKVVFDDASQALQAVLMSLPNIPDETVPEGRDETGNVEVRRWGTPRGFDVAAQDHVSLGERGGLMDFDVAATMAQSRFVALKGELAQLQRALTQFMLDTHVNEHGYQEVYVPFLVNEDALKGTGQLPKFGDDLFRVDLERPLYLIPTAEVPVTNLYRDQILAMNDFPIKMVCHTPCFRSEAGSYGRDTRGMIRQHQFEKVELVQLVPPQESQAAHEALTLHAEAILQKLELPYRVMNLCGGDLGASSSKTYDLEVWLPGQNQYREISSCSNFKDFQARRLQARYRIEANAKPELVHTINGSGLAVGRTLVAVLENFQDDQGQVTVPDALRPYLGGKTQLLAQ
ncbi:serine--tRNA ligase [Pseudomonadales bacterium]|jgi:seryl-tRNA synthetase|nr:serine--tRNA ligase [Gammaproteobacteria bacterium]MDA8628168.1 serine--tRNA ligase [Pseudomonadales bacterium]